MTDRPVAPAAARNREPILDVLLGEFADRRAVLEIGSGTGEHAVFFAAKMPWLTWQTSDRQVQHAGIEAWIQHAGGANVLPPLLLDVNDPPAVTDGYDAVFSANTAHIMSEGEVGAMFRLVGRVLPPGGRFCLYVRSISAASSRATATGDSINRCGSRMLVWVSAISRASIGRRPTPACRDVRCTRCLPTTSSPYGSASRSSRKRR